MQHDLHHLISSSVRFRHSTTGLLSSIGADCSCKETAFLDLTSLT